MKIHLDEKTYLKNIICSSNIYIDYILLIYIYSFTNLD